ncbi:protein kinase [Achlya hypogyna]|uniref:Protein kinase n=1 Tax=Achlya hypogyna TaxID=1202772 RepID=A0A1V9YAD9_ACHHY|nr:protein kinase [Achlya hypogyna]
MELRELTNLLFECVATGGSFWLKAPTPTRPTTYFICEARVADDAGETLMHLAVRYDMPELLELLLQTNGVDASIRNQEGDTPLLVAVKRGHRCFAHHIFAVTMQPLREAAVADIDINWNLYLGHGSSGVVCKGTFNRQPVAVKTASCNDGETIIREIIAAQRCQSPYLLQPLAIAGQNTPRPLIVLEYMDGGNLREYLNNKRNGVPVAFEYSALEVAWVVANALADLHHNGIVHRNLTSNKVVLSSTNYIKVGGFGLSRKYASQMTGGVGTALWMAPEVIALDGFYDFAADIYSFGVILTELSTLQMPYAGSSLSPLHILHRVHTGTLRPEIGDAPQWLRELATACLAHDPAQRPNTEEILTLLDRQRRLEYPAPVVASEPPLTATNSASGLPNSPGSSGNTSAWTYSEPFLVSTEILCLVCDASHSIAAVTCVNCGEPMIESNAKLEILLHRITTTNHQGLDIDMTLPCSTCWAPNFFMDSMCDDGDTPVIAAIKQGRRHFAQQIHAASTKPPREVEAADIKVYHTTELGRGGYGMVYMGELDNQAVAIKVGFSPSGTDALFCEMEAMQRCNSPYLLPLLAVSGQHTESLQLVLEFMDGGDLRGYLDKRRKGSYVPVEYSALEVAWVIANALADLHHNGLLHRDLKSSNVLLSSTKYIKVCDLGCAGTNSSQMTQNLGTTSWKAPEVLAGADNYDSASDIYSFGVILTELSSLNLPYVGLTQYSILRGVIDGTLRPDVGDNCPMWLRELATACMAHDPEQRPNAQRILTLLDRQRRLEAARPVPATADTPAQSNGVNNINSDMPLPTLLNASLISTAMVCFFCQAFHSIVAVRCPGCDEATPAPATKLKVLLQRVAIAKQRGHAIETTLTCLVCNSRNDFKATECVGCGANELYDDDEKLRLLVRIIARATRAGAAG